MSLAEVLTLMAIGLSAGVLGGLAGVGGSMVMIPGMALLMGYSDAAKTEQHLYAAASMAVNVFVSMPAALKHRRQGAVRHDLFWNLMPAMSLAIVAGVLISNRIDGLSLKRLLAAFIAFYCVLNIVRVVRHKPEVEAESERTTRARVIVIAVAGGLVAGILGLGGGVVIVPLMQVFCRVRLRHAIGSSLAVMSVTAIIGAGFKIGTLPEHGLRMGTALGYVAALAPGAMLGGHLGASLNHRLPISGVRIAISVLLIIVAARLAGIF
ncbi:MAG: sulfite exporter TauE/SafE family protein [Phycisphaerales bacterium]|nr:sulfite exporter TauE/SafE family protein [Phycisphaerales bacterium]